jgi:hypothetical protein
MGQLTNFDLTSLIDDYCLKNYVETGTGMGISLSHALSYKSLDNLFSIEIDPQLANSRLLHQQISEAKSTTQTAKVLNSDSISGLRVLLQNVINESPTLFFLDAHFPGSDFFSVPYGDSVDASSTAGIPLLLEMAEISNSRNSAKKDLIIIDDLFLFEDGEFAFGTEHPEKVQSIRSMLRERDLFLGDSFPAVLRLLFGPNRQFRRFYEHQGYLMILPE